MRDNTFSGITERRREKEGRGAKMQQKSIVLSLLYNIVIANFGIWGRWILLLTPIPMSTDLGREGGGWVGP